MKELRIGIDASINCTGICFTTIDLDKKETHSDYYAVIPFEKPKVLKRKSTKIPKKKWSDSINIVEFIKMDIDSKVDNFSYQDISKVISAKNLAIKIKETIIKYTEDKYYDEISVRMEGALMSSGFSAKHARVNDLIAYAVETRNMLVYDEKLSKLINYISLVAPKTLKKLATGNGNASKEFMIEKHQDIFAGLFDYYGKIDDVIDAYWLSVINIEDNKVGIYEIMKSNFELYLLQELKEKQNLEKFAQEL